MELPSVHVQEMNIKLADDEAADGQKTNPRPNAEEAPKCPRCDSGNTKFCYYNNYSLSQPRYFCKACRRYWTKGGTLRNVPIGGGCRKNKKSAKRALIESHFSHLLAENGLENVLSSSSSFSSPLSYESNSGTSESLSMAFARLQKQCDGDANLGFGFGHHHQGPILGNQPRTNNLGFVNNFSTSDHQSLYSYGFENIGHHTQPLLPCEDPMSESVKLELNSNTGLNDNIILSGFPWQMEKQVNNGGLTLESDYNLKNIINNNSHNNNNLVLGSNSINVGTGYDEVGRESWDSGRSALAAADSSWPNLINNALM